METEPMNQPQSDANPSPSGPNRPKKTNPQSIYPTPTAPSFFTPSPGLSKSTLKDGKAPPQTPVITQPSPYSKKRGQNMGKILMMLVIFALGVGTGFMVHANLPESSTTSAPQTSEVAKEDNGDQQSQAPSDDLDSWARDSHRRADIDSAHASLEAYHSENGYYPPESVYNSKSSASAAFPGMNMDDLEDPQGRFINSPGSDYRYATKDCNPRCESYELVTFLEGGDGSYTNNSQN